MQMVHIWLCCFVFSTLAPSCLGWPDWSPWYCPRSCSTDSDARIFMYSLQFWPRLGCWPCLFGTLSLHPPPQWHLCRQRQRQPCWKTHPLNRNSMIRLASKTRRHQPSTIWLAWFHWLPHCWPCLATRLDWAPYPGHTQVILHFNGFNFLVFFSNSYSNFNTLELKGLATQHALSTPSGRVA